MGKQKEQKEYTEGIAVGESRALSWLDNFWYHYKWVTIVVAFFLIVGIVCIAQACSVTPVDVNLTYAGPATLSSAQKLAIHSVVARALPEGFSDKDSAEVNLINYYILSKEQIEEEQKKTNADGSPVYVDTYFITNEQETFESQMMTGSGAILLIDPSIFDSLGGNAQSVRLRKLSEVLGYTPEGAINDFGIRLGDTELYRSNPELRVLPEDTVLCLHAKVVSQKQKDYDKQVEAFKALAIIAESEAAD